MPGSDVDKENAPEQIELDRDRRALLRVMLRSEIILFLWLAGRPAFRLPTREAAADDTRPDHHDAEIRSAQSHDAVCNARVRIKIQLR